MNKDEIIGEFENRNGDIITVRFDIPDIPLDTLHPQLRKTTEALERKLNNEEFNVFKADYWSDEKSNAVILLEMASSTLNDIKVNVGPKIFIDQACENFANKYGRENIFVQEDFLVHTQKRDFNQASDLIRHIFTQEHIGLIKVGKNLKRNIIDTYEFIAIDKLAYDNDYLEFLDDFLNPGQHLVR